MPIDQSYSSSWTLKYRFKLLFFQQTDTNPRPICKKDEINGSNNILDGILSNPKKPDLNINNEKSGLLASMLQEKKDQHMVNGEHHIATSEQYKKMNGSKRPASTEPTEGTEVTAPKKPLLDATNGDAKGKYLRGN